MQREQNLCLLPQADSPMFTPATETSTDLTMNLLVHYSFDLSGYSASQLVARWQKEYPLSWLHLAVIEALYQGRYKAISVQQILSLWQRRGQATFHFNMEFERLICSKFPENLTLLPSSPVLPVKTSNNNSVLENPPSLAEKAPAYAHSQLGDDQSQWKTREYKRQLWQEDNTDEYLATSQDSLNSVPEKNNSDYWQSNAHHSPTLNELTKLLPAVVNHPPIGQFTPEMGDRSDSFTSKLKAMSGDRHVRPRLPQARVEANGKA